MAKLTLDLHDIFKQGGQIDATPSTTSFAKPKQKIPRIEITASKKTSKTSAASGSTSTTPDPLPYVIIPTEVQT
jgi:hypothetical protein